MAGPLEGQTGELEHRHHVMGTLIRKSLASRGGVSFLLTLLFMHLDLPSSVPSRKCGLGPGGGRGQGKERLPGVHGGGSGLPAPLPSLSFPLCS